jgi:hypothetical protein
MFQKIWTCRVMRVIGITWGKPLLMHWEKANQLLEMEKAITYIVHLGQTMIDALGKSKPTFGNGESNYLYSLNWKIETVQKKESIT